MWMLPGPPTDPAGIVSWVSAHSANGDQEHRWAGDMKANWIKPSKKKEIRFLIVEDILSNQQDFSFIFSFWAYDSLG